MMQTHSTSTDEDIGAGEEKDACDDRTGGTGRGSLPPFGTLLVVPPHGPMRDASLADGLQRS